MLKVLVKFNNWWRFTDVAAAVDDIDDDDDSGDQGCGALIFCGTLWF